MTVFISHSSRDHAAVRLLVQNLQTAHESVWLDQSLVGGEAWWHRILHQIRSCTVFMVALSNSCLQSKPCRAEIDYAKALGLPILPVLIGDVDSYRIDPIFTVQSVDFRNPDVASGAALIAAVRERAAERKELPDPLPEPPPVPYEYLQRLGVAIDSPEELSPTEQATILADLRQALRQEDDESVREDIRRLLRALRRRSEVTHGHVYEIDDLLRRFPDSGGHSVVSPELESAAGTIGETRAASADSAQHPVEQPATTPADAKPIKSRLGMTPKTVAIVGAATVVVAVIAIVAFLVGWPFHGSGPNRPAATTAPAAIPIGVAALDGLLLSPAQINNTMGAANMTVTNSFDSIEPNTAPLSDEKCRPIHGATTDSAYAGSGWIANRGQLLQTPGDNPTHSADQEVVLFPAAKDAAAFFSASAQRWAACSNTQFTAPQNDKPPDTWNVGALTNENGTLSITKTSGWSCQRALTATNNVVVDVGTCSYNVANSAVNIAHQIAAKVAKQ